MTNLTDYINWRSDITFEQVCINEIDSLIFTEISYLPFEDIVSSPERKKCITLKKLGEKFFSVHKEDESIGAIIPSKDIVGLLRAVMNTERYKNVKVWGYVNSVAIKAEKQFSAICFDISGSETYVAYRGTDDTIIGWKENFNMARLTPIPSQTDGVEYLNKVAPKAKEKIYVGGHSKGGNLAIYSAVFASDETKGKIEWVHSFDGPGFKKKFIDSIENKSMFKKIKNIIPSGSTVGMIFDLIGETEIVVSKQKGLKQHDAFSWGVMGDKFITAENMKKSALELHNLLIKWTDGMTEKETTDFIEALYKISTSSEASTLTEISAERWKFMIAVLKSDSQTKKTVFSALQKLLKEKYSGFGRKKDKEEKTDKEKEKNNFFKFLKTKENKNNK